MRVLMLIGLSASFALPLAFAAQNAAGCNPAGNVQFVCGQVSPEELSGGTFTLTNTGSRGALFDTPIINQPQVGILGVGSVVKRSRRDHDGPFSGWCA